MMYSDISAIVLDIVYPKHIQFLNAIPHFRSHKNKFQCFNESQRSNVSHITLTASGGPFLNLGRKDLTNVKPIDAIKHPTWRMGKKISVDSATMVNKALESITQKQKRIQQWLLRWDSRLVDFNMQGPLQQ